MSHKKTRKTNTRLLLTSTGYYTKSLFLPIHSCTEFYHFITRYISHISKRWTFIACKPVTLTIYYFALVIRSIAFRYKLKLFCNDCIVRQHCLLNIMRLGSYFIALFTIFGIFYFWKECHITIVMLKRTQNVA